MHDLPTVSLSLSVLFHKKIRLKKNAKFQLRIISLEQVRVVMLILYFPVFLPSRPGRYSQSYPSFTCSAWRMYLNLTSKHSSFWTQFTQAPAKKHKLSKVLSVCVWDVLVMGTKQQLKISKLNKVRFPPVSRISYAAQLWKMLENFSNSTESGH